MIHLASIKKQEIGGSVGCQLADALPMEEMKKWILQYWLTKNKDTYIKAGLLIEQDGEFALVDLGLTNDGESIVWLKIVEINAKTETWLDKYKL